MLQKLDAVTVRAPDLNRGLRFYRDALGHRLKWRHDDIGQAGLWTPGSHTLARGTGAGFQSRNTGRAGVGSLGQAPCRRPPGRQPGPGCQQRRQQQDQGAVERM